jgi:hypothetical protein
MDIQGKGKTVHRVQLIRAHNKAANVRCTKCNFAGYFQGRGIILIGFCSTILFPCNDVYAVHGV